MGYDFSGFGGGGGPATGHSGLISAINGTSPITATAPGTSALLASLFGDKSQGVSGSAPGTSAYNNALSQLLNTVKSSPGTYSASSPASYSNLSTAISKSFLPGGKSATSSNKPTQNGILKDPDALQALLDKYLAPGEAPKTAEQQAQAQLAQAQKLLDELYKQQTLQAPEYNPYTPQYADIPALSGTIPSISSAGDNITPTISSLALADAREQLKSELNNSNYQTALGGQVAESNSAAQRTGAINDTMQVLNTMINSMLGYDYNNKLYDYNVGQDQNKNDQWAQQQAQSRIVAGIGTSADFALLGVQPGTYTYDQLNALAQLENERKKVELSGLAMTV
jgi:hypothetical protein